jgi:hypothetical protein
MAIALRRKQRVLSKHGVRQILQTMVSAQHWAWCLHHGCVVVINLQKSAQNLGVKPVTGGEFLCHLISYFYWLLKDSAPWS